MATEKNVVAASVPVVDEITLTEFCTRLSITDKRVELIAGFYSGEVASGCVKDVESAFSARFSAFISKPV